jgi:Ca2+-binding EF-hand superfamily protein
MIRLPILAPLALATMLACAAATPAVAQETDLQSAMHWFDGIDVDKDEAMSMDELVGLRAKRFRRTDGNQDLYLSVDEFLFGLPANRQDEAARMRRQFEQMDTDHNGFVAEQEYMDYGGTIMTTADANRDGKVTRDEFAATVPQAAAPQ